MLAGLIALTFSAAFCSAAIYINLAEHPARMLLDDTNALAQWGPSYDRAFNYQGGLAVLSGAAGARSGMVFWQLALGDRCWFDAVQLALYIGRYPAAQPSVESGCGGRSRPRIAGDAHPLE